MRLFLYDYGSNVRSPSSPGAFPKFDVSAPLSIGSDHAAAAALRDYGLPT